uniref:Uncharacterized protein n=1 Tax=Arundo donax TaxID=35708 RepID=A0A0A8Y3Y0_ARUDO
MILELARWMPELLVSLEESNGCWCAGITYGLGLAAMG